MLAWGKYVTTERPNFCLIVCQWTFYYIYSENSLNLKTSWLNKDLDSERNLTLIWNILNIQLLKVYTSKHIAPSHPTPESHIMGPTKWKAKNVKCFWWDFNHIKDRGGNPHGKYNIIFFNELCNHIVYACYSANRTY